MRLSMYTVSNGNGGSGSSSNATNTKSTIKLNVKFPVLCTFYGKTNRQEMDWHWLLVLAKFGVCWLILALRYQDKCLKHTKSLTLQIKWLHNSHSKYYSSPFHASLSVSQLVRCVRRIHSHSLHFHLVHVLLFFSSSLAMLILSHILLRPVVKI